MVATKQLFISHSWAYSDSYERLVSLLDKRAYFVWKDFSVPKNDPIHTSGSDAALRSAIVARVQLCHVVLIMAGVYSTYSKWINIEINVAQHAFVKPKPIVAIQPWGAERTSSVVKAAATRLVGWNTESIVSAIRAAG
ncbi:MAG: TIR domain-containing protein [Chloroflexi bacterium]|nr:TIR domain-containing protein [Chloroflexota bacterium]